MIKVYGGTRRDGKWLCRTCVSGVVMRSSSESEERIHCYHTGKFVGMKVVECSEYKDRAAPTLREMRKCAWLVSTSRSGRQIGFLSPREAADKLGDYDIPGEFD